MGKQIQVRIRGKIHDDRPGYPFDIEVHYYLGEPPFIVSFVEPHHISRFAALTHMKREVDKLLDSLDETFGVEKMEIMKRKSHDS